MSERQAEVAEERRALAAERRAKEEAARREAAARQAAAPALGFGGDLLVHAVRLPASGNLPANSSLTHGQAGRMLVQPVACAAGVGLPARGTAADMDLVRHAPAMKQPACLAPPLSALLCTQPAAGAGAAA